MTEKYICPGATEAMIYMKNGSIKYGLITDALLTLPFFFLAAQNVDSFIETGDPQLLQILCEEEVYSVDVVLK